MIEDTNFFDLLGLDTIPNEQLAPQGTNWPLTHRELCVEVFTNMPTQHGTYFDNGTRWCEGCQSTRTPFKVEKTSNWSKKACPNCEMIWPEYEYEFQWKLKNDPDFLDEIDLTIIMPLDIN